MAYLIDTTAAGPSAAEYCRDIGDWLRENPDAWTQGVYARDQSGAGCDPGSLHARRWCALGLLERFIPCGVTRLAALERLDRALPHDALGVPRYNDRSTTTVNDIITLFERAALIPVSVGAIAPRPTAPDWKKIAFPVDAAEVAEIEARNAAIAAKLIPWEDIMAQIQSSIAA